MKNLRNKKNNKRKKLYLFLGVGAGVLALGGLGYWYFFGRKGTKIDDPDNDLFHKLDQEQPAITYTPPKTQSYSPPPISHSGFPLKKGSKGALVKQLQEALISRYGKSILPKYGADGDFGSETVKALSSKGFPSVIDFATFTKIVSGNTNSPAPPSASTVSSGITTSEAVSIASGLNSNIENEKFWETVADFKKIKSGSDYKTVNEVFRSLNSGDDSTITEAMLEEFDDSTQKAYLLLLFAKLGLKAKDGVWTVAGLGCPPTVMTRCSTHAHSSNGDTVKLPANTILGKMVCERNGITTFKTIDGKLLNAPSKYLSHV